MRHVWIPGLARIRRRNLHLDGAVASSWNFRENVRIFTAAGAADTEGTMAPQKVIGRTALAFLLAGTIADKVLAHGLGDFQQYVRGFTISDPLGAVPPPGLYFENTGLYVPNAPGNGQLGTVRANAILDTPTLFWSTGYSFLGASVAASISQPFYQATVWANHGQWEIGPVAYFAWQMTNDQPGGGFTCAQMSLATAGTATCGRANDYALGALVGYDFGPANLRAYFTDAINTRDNFGGLFVWTKLSFRLWAPESPAAAPPKKTSRMVTK
jgi:hypothetical protein